MIGDSSDNRIKGDAKVRISWYISVEMRKEENKWRKEVSYFFAIVMYCEVERNSLPHSRTLNEFIFSFPGKFRLDAIHSAHTSRTIKNVSEPHRYYSSCQTCLWPHYWPCSRIFLLWQVNIHICMCRINVQNYAIDPNNATLFCNKTQLIKIM